MGRCCLPDRSRSGPWRFRNARQANQVRKMKNWLRKHPEVRTIRVAAADLNGQPRGICGAATRTASLAQAKLFTQLIANRGDSIDVIGVGGVTTAEDVRSYLNAGTSAVHIATAAMVDPLTGIAIRRTLAAETGGESSRAQ